MISKILLLVEQVGSTTPQIYNLWTPVSIFFQTRTFSTIECITNSFTTTYNTFVCIVSKRTFVADSHEGGWSNVGIAHWAFSVTFVTETADADAGGFAAHDKVRMMARHDMR